MENSWGFPQLQKSRTLDFIFKSNTSRKMNVFIDILSQASPDDTFSHQQQGHSPAQTTIKDKIRRASPKKTKKNMPDKRMKWTRGEQRKYLQFLINNREIFSLQAKQKKKAKPFVILAKSLRSKDQLQCRSHHQKMLHKHGDIAGIIAFLSERECQSPETNEETEHQNKMGEAEEGKVVRQEEGREKGGRKAWEEEEMCFPDSLRLGQCMDSDELELPILSPLVHIWSEEQEWAYLS